MEPITFEVERSKRLIKLEMVQVDFVYNIPIVDADNKVLGRAVLTKNIDGFGPDMKEKVVLMDIIVYDPEDRGKGVGDELMGFLTSGVVCSQILTGWNTEAGRKLCLKWGFKYKEFRGVKVLVWEDKKAETEPLVEGV